MTGDLVFDRSVLVDVLVYHWRTSTSGCGCGWTVLGASHPEHVADVYEAPVAARREGRQEDDMSSKVRFPTWPSDNPEGDWLLMDPDERDEWFDWFTRHGIDANYVTAAGTVIADDRVRRICYVAYETDERGQVRVRDGEMVRVGRVVQLEARAMPFPAPETGV